MAFDQHTRMITEGNAAAADYDHCVILISWSAWQEAPWTDACRFSQELLSLQHSRLSTRPPAAWNRSCKVVISKCHTQSQDWGLSFRKKAVNIWIFNYMKKNKRIHLPLLLFLIWNDLHGHAHHHLHGININSWWSDNSTIKVMKLVRLNWKALLGWKFHKTPQTPLLVNIGHVVVVDKWKDLSTWEMSMLHSSAASEPGENNA